MDRENAVLTAVGELLSTSAENGTAKTFTIQQAHTGRWTSMTEQVK
jgi:hypothetical protein